MNQRRHGPRANARKDFLCASLRSTFRSLRFKASITKCAKTSHRTPGTTSQEVRSRIRYNFQHSNRCIYERGVMDVLTQIQEIHAREVLDSRGNPTVEAEVTLIGG